MIALAMQRILIADTISGLHLAQLNTIIFEKECTEAERAIRNLLHCFLLTYTTVWFFEFVLYIFNTENNVIFEAFLVLKPVLVC